MNQTWPVTVFFFALLSVILYSAFLILTPFLTAIIWAMILAILFYPLYAWLLRLLRGRATLASIIVIVCITLLVIVPGLELAWFLSDEAVLLVKSFRSLMTEDGKQEWLAQPWVQQLIGWWNTISFSLIDFKINWREGLMQGAQKSSAFVVGQITGVAQNVLLFAVNFFVALLTLFFLLRDGRDFLWKCQRLLPMDREHQQRLLKNIVDAVLAVIHGSFVVAIVQGLLAGLAYWFLGVPFAVLWGVVTGFLRSCRSAVPRWFPFRRRFICFCKATPYAELSCWRGASALSAPSTTYSSRCSSAIAWDYRFYFYFLASLAVFLCSARWVSFSAR